MAGLTLVSSKGLALHPDITRQQGISFPLIWKLPKHGCLVLLREMGELGGDLWFYAGYLDFLLGCLIL